MPPSKTASKHEYDKLRLKEQIENALKSFIDAGKNIERVAPLCIPEPLALVRAASLLPEESFSE